MQITPWQKKKIERIFVFALILTPSFLGYFFVPGPLGGLKPVSGDVFGSTDSIGSFKENIYFSSKNQIFAKGKYMVLHQK